MATAGRAFAALFLLVGCAPLNASTIPDLSASCRGTCMKDRVVLITNATSGVGRQTALELSRMGAEVIVHGSDPEAAQRTAAELKSEWLAADPSSMDAVRRLAAEVKQRWGKLDVLINVGLPRNATPSPFATNHLAPFLLTNLLLPELMKGVKPRVVQVATAAYTASPIDFDDPTSARDPGEAFPRAKTANLLFMRELARRTAGTGLTVNALHAGLGNILLAVLLADDDEAATTCAVYLAMSNDVAGVTGTYFVEGAPHEPKPFAKDEQLQLRLWELSAQLVNLTH